MATTVASLVVRMSADVSALKTGFTDAQRAAHGLASAAKEAGQTLTLALTAPLALAAGSAVLAARDMDNLRRGLTAVAGSAEEADRQLTRLQEVAKLPGLGFQEAIQGSVSLQAAGLSANMAERALSAFGNALATVGKGKADLDGVILALTQIQSKGKISAEEINQLNERVPQVRQAMLKAFGTADTEKLGKSGLTATRFISGLIDELNKLPQVTGGVGNAFENMSDALFRAKAAIGEALLPAIVPLVNGLASVLVKVTAIDPAVVRTVASFAAVAAAIGPLLILLSSLTTAVTALATALSIGLLPLIAVGGPILIGLGLLAAAFVQTKLEALAAAAAAEEAAAQFASALRRMDQATLEATLQSKEAQTNALIRARNQLQDQVNALRSTLPADDPASRPGVSARTQGSENAVTRALRQAAKDQAAAVSNNAATFAQIRQKEQTVTGLNDLIADRTKELSAVSNELLARQVRSTATPFVLPNVQGTDKLRAAREVVQEFIRDLRLLQRFNGVLSLDDLPDGFSAAVNEADRLDDRVNRLSDSLAKLGAQAPPEGFTALEALNAQLKRSQRELQSLADKYNATVDRIRGGMTDRDFAKNRLGRQNIITSLAAAPKERPSVALEKGVQGQPLNEAGQVLKALRVLGEGVGQAGEAGLGFAHDLRDLGSIFGGSLKPNISLLSAGLLSLREAALVAGRALGDAFVQAAGQGGQFSANLVNATQSLMKSGQSFAAAAPAALAFASATEIATGFFQALAPALEALTYPLQVMGEILAIGVVPILRMLYPVIKAVAIVFSYVQEVFDRVLGAILVAVGGFIRAIGKVINALVPFANPGNPLVKAGEAIAKTGKGFQDAADEVAKKRKELEELDFDGALKNAKDGADKLAESLVNAANGFKIERFRFGATAIQKGADGSPRAPSGPQQSQATTNISGVSTSVTIENYSSDSPRDAYRKLWQGMKEVAAGNPKFRDSIFALYPAP